MRLNSRQRKNHKDTGDIVNKGGQSKLAVSPLVRLTALRPVSRRVLDTAAAVLNHQLQANLKEFWPTLYRAYRREVTARNVKPGAFKPGPL